MKYSLLFAITILLSTKGFTQDNEQNKKTENDTIKNLNEVVISSKIGVTQIEPQKVLFSTKDLPSENGGTAGDILKNMLSVSMGGSPNHNRDIRYRGLGNGYTTVLINGKQSGLIGNNRETVLDMLPASQIDYIEIISTPTADQTSNGINGIVNIVTKKGIKTNQNGQIQVFADNQNGYNGSVNLQHASDNFSISGSFDKLKRNANKYDTGTQTKFNTDGSLKETVVIDKSEIKAFDNSIATAKIGYKTKDRWGFSAEYIYGEQIEDKEKEELNQTYKNDGTFKSGKKRFTPEYKTSKFNNPSININKHWKNSSLDFILNSNFTTETKDNLQKDYNTNAAGEVLYTSLPTQQLALENIDFKNYFPSVAFKSTLGKNGTFKTGFQSFLTNRWAEKITTKLNNATNTWEPVTAGTFTFDLNENTFAGYVSANWDLNKFKLILGYRHEYTNIESESSSIENSINKSNYHLALPNFNLTYSLTDKSYLKSSIGRRVRRPAYADMNPFVEIKSATEIKVGNPNLIPEKAWAYELGYFNEIRNINFGVNVFHRDITDLIQKNITTETDGITTESFTNLDKAVSTGVEFLVGYQPVKWYNLNVNFSRFWSEIKDNTSFDGDALKDQTDWTFKAINDFSPAKGFNLQFIANFVGPKKTTQETEETIWFADLGLEKQLFTNGFFTIRVTDVFDTLKKQKTKNTIIQIEEMTENAPGRIFSAGFRYQF
jgi:outer membrane receptor for ferrienterochelin and colicin